MANWFGRWMKRRQRHGAARSGGPAATFHAAARPEDDSRIAVAAEQCIPLPNQTPFEMLRVYRYLRDAIPDISDAIWTWKRLCQTGFDIEICDASSGVAERRVRRLLDELNRRVNGGDRGMDGLLDLFYASLFTYGAAALEIVLTHSRESIWDLVPVDAWTVRFKRDGGRLLPYQLHEGELIPLPPERFIYVGMERDGSNPYGRSMLRSIPFVVKIQQRLLEDMAKATHNAGWSKLHVQYSPEERQRGESVEDYHARMGQNLERIRAKLSGLSPDQNLITYDNVKVALVQGGQAAQVFYENHKAIEEQVITGMHLMPILIGRNYGTTETYGTAQFEIVNRQVESVNRAVKRILERLYNFELALMWGEARAKVHMRANRTVDILKAAQARAREIENAARLQELGYADRASAAAMLNLPGKLA